MNDAYYMKLALALAERGGEAVRPNPLVGCVIVKNDKILAQGWHQVFGGPHAEVEAIHQLKPGENLSAATVYVTLEPCAHFGKTPPCADLLVTMQPSRVVIAMIDPNPLVAGKGIARLKAAGIEVEVGIEEAAAKELNKHFVVFHQLNRPFVTLKWAMTSDGFISRWPVPQNREHNIVTGPSSQQFTHQLRAQHMAIMVGSKTVEADNPSLTVRLVKGKDPLPIIIDRTLRLSEAYRLLGGDRQVLVYNTLKSFQRGAVEYVAMANTPAFLKHLLQDLHQRKVHSLLVEGGTQLHQLFIASNLWDEMLVFVNPNLKFKEGLLAPEVNLPKDHVLLGSDYLFRIKNNPLE